MSSRGLLSGVMGLAFLCTGVTTWSAEVEQTSPVPVVEAASEDDGWVPSIALSADLASRYFSEGAISNDEPTTQIDLSISLKDFTVGVWTCIDLTDRVGYGNEPEEWDYYVTYAPSIGGDWAVIKGLDFTFGYWYYDYPRASEADSQELEFAVNAQCLLSPGIDLYWDFENDLFYGSLNASHETPLDFISDKLTWENSCELWWGNSHYNCNDNYNWAHMADEKTYKNCFFAFVWTTKFTFKIDEHFSFGPFLQLGYALDNDIRNEWKEDPMQNAVNFCWGANLSMEF